MTSVKGTVLVTGANGGLGSAIVEQLASNPKFASHYGIYTVRDMTRAAALTSSSAHEVMALDLTKLDNVRQVAEVINTRVSAGEIPPIRSLILNAGFQDFGKQSWTSDGLDTTFAANYLGHWLLTLLLLKSMDKEAGRIVFIGSQSHDPNDPRNASGGAFADPKYKTFVSDANSFQAIAKGTWSPATEDAGFRGGFRRYGASKLFLVMMQHELQARLDADTELSKLCVIGIDPGTMATGMQRLAPWVIRVLFFKVIFPFLLYISPNNAPLRPPSRVACDVLEETFGMGERGELPKDKYLHGRVPKETSDESRDVAKRALVWSETIKLTGLKEGETVLTNWQ